MIKMLCSVSAVALLAGCATSPIAANQATPTSRVFAFQQPVAQSATVDVTRDKGIFGMACGTLIAVDNRKAAILGHGQTVALTVPAGRHIVAAKMKGGLCQMGTRDALVDPSAGDTVHLRVSLGGQGDMEIGPAVD